jgi:hypothetical protein
MFLYGLRLLNGDTEEKDYYFFYPSAEERLTNIEKFNDFLGKNNNGLQTFEFDCANEEIAETLLGNSDEKELH